MRTDKISPRCLLFTSALAKSGESRLNGGMALDGKTILFLVSEDWYFCSHRLPMARAARDAGARVMVACRVKDHADHIRAEGFHLYPISLNRSGRNPLADLSAILEIRRLYAEVEPDLVHQVAMKPVLYGSIAAWLAGVPFVVNAMAGLGFLFISGGLFARIARPVIATLFKVILNRRNTCLIVQNPDDRELFVTGIDVQPERIRIIRGSGVDIDRFQPNPEPDGPVVATCVSRMLWDKGIGELVEAARILKGQGRDIIVRLVGPTDDNPASIPQEALDHWNDEGIVDTHGPADNIAELYAGSHIAVLPSYREGLPKSLLEAAACGRAMVATDVPGCREICRNGETGISVPVCDPESLAQAIATLADDAPLRNRYAAAARHAAETEFAETVIVEETLALYRNLLRHHF